MLSDAAQGKSQVKEGRLKMLFNKEEKMILTIWGCERRNLTVQRLAFAAAYAVDPSFKKTVCRTRDRLISGIQDEHYSLYFNNVIRPRQGHTDFAGLSRGGYPA